MNNLKARLDAEVAKRNDPNEVSETAPDPILVAREYQDPVISLVCALFAYGNVPAILKLLRSFDFSLLDAPETEIKKALSDHYYRFQTSGDITNLFITLRRLKCETDMEEAFLKGYRQEESVLDGIASLITLLERLNPYDSRGYRFLISRAPEKKKTAGASPLKRWNMFLRWMVRKDHIDFGLWRDVATKDLLIPLDTHTFAVSKKLGLVKRKSYDLKAVMEVTESLRKFDPDDPVKYDFALYRMGQKKLIR